MALTDMFLTRALADFRRYSDEPEINAKYTDGVVYQKIEEAYAHVLAEINRNHTQPIVARFEVTYVADQENYALPYTIGSIYAVYQKSTTGNSRVFYYSKGRENTWGRGVWVEGYTLHIMDTAGIDAGDIITVEYTPAGIARMCNGTVTIDSTGLLATLPSTPTTGTLDTHANAYAGSVFRIVHDTDSSYDYTQERTITAYDNVTRVCTLDVALSPNAGDGVQSGTTSGEIAPFIHMGMDHIVALYQAMLIVGIEGEMARANWLQKAYMNAIRNVRLNAFYSNVQDCTTVRSDSLRRRRYRRRG